MSPFLFIIAVEGLIIALKVAADKGFFKRIRLPNGGPTLTSLHFADDALLLGEWDNGNIRNILKILKCFHQASGYFGYSFEYLGMPIGASMKTLAGIPNFRR